MDTENVMGNRGLYLLGMWCGYLFGTSGQTLRIWNGIQPSPSLQNLNVVVILIMLFRAIYTSAICSARARTKPFIKKFPVTLRLQYPSWDTPGLAEFASAEDITAFLSTPKQFLIEPITGQIIRPHQVDKIDPDVIYDVAGSGLPYREKGLSREQVWDRVFERKTALALKETLENEDTKVRNCRE